MYPVIPYPGSQPGWGSDRRVEVNVLMGVALAGALAMQDYLEAMSVAIVVLIATRITNLSLAYVEKLVSSTEGTLPPQVGHDSRSGVFRKGPLIPG
jgi:hypothetical protein